MSPPLEVIAVLGVTLISRLVEIFNETWIETFLRKICVPKYCCNIWSNWGRKRRQWSLLVDPQTHFTDCSIWIIFIWMTPLSLLRNSRFPISTPEYAQLVVCTDSAGNFSRPETTFYNTTVSIQGQLIFLAFLSPSATSLNLAFHPCKRSFRQIIKKLGSHALMFVCKNTIEWKLKRLRPQDHVWYAIITAPDIRHFISSTIRLVSLQQMFSILKKRYKYIWYHHLTRGGLLCELMANHYKQISSLVSTS